jgi:Uncharacterized flagellar protein FlaG
MLVQSSNTQSFHSSNDTLFYDKTTSENDFSNDVTINPSQKDKPLMDFIKKNDKELEGKNTSVQYSIHEKTNDLIIKIVDNETKEILREIPSEEILDMISDMCEK